MKRTAGFDCCSPENPRHKLGLHLLPPSAPHLPSAARHVHLPACITRCIGVVRCTVMCCQLHRFLVAFIIGTRHCSQPVSGQAAVCAEA